MGMGNLRSFGTPCDQHRRGIVLYLDDELLEPHLSEFQAHLTRCAACRKALADERRFVRELRSARALTTPSRALRASVESILRIATAVVVLTGVAWIRRLLP